eukprot:15264527-Heterocapsa_arctica.AAC.1
MGAVVGGPSWIAEALRAKISCGFHPSRRVRALGSSVRAACRSPRVRATSPAPCMEARSWICA